MVGLVVALALLALLFCLALLRLWHYQQEASRLGGEVDRFLSGELSQPAFSVRDGAFAHFENSVVELETRLLQAAALRQAEHERSRQAIADLSHQLMTPLSSLKLYCELDQAPHAPQQLALIERMEGMIGALLRLERLEAGVYPFAFESCDLYALCEEILSAFGPLYPGKRLRLEGRAQLRCDVKWMSQAIGNLVKNACEHTRDDGEISILISRGETAVTLSVQDNGGGVPQEEVGQIFKRFFRSSRPHAHQGAGLGLSIVREIVRRHHGTLSASNEDKGLRVSMVLPDLKVNLKES